MSKNKTHIVSARYTDDEYLDILMKVTGTDGKTFMSPGQFSKCAALSAKVVVVDRELEEYKVFLAYKISNSINQIAQAIHMDRQSGVVSQSTYDLATQELQQLHAELFDVLELVKG